MNEKMKAYREEHGLRPYGALFNQELRSQKVVRAVYSENQLVEVMTDFWFNHFNVTTRDGGARSRVLSYERDAIRPNVLGKFRVIWVRRRSILRCCIIWIMHSRVWGRRHRRRIRQNPNR